MTATSKITYTSASGDLNEFHRQFDVALQGIRSASGALHPFYIGGRAVRPGAEPLVDRSPIDTSFVLGRFEVASRAHVDTAVGAAKNAHKGWARQSWRERVATLRRAATLIRQQKYELAALMSLEVGKSRLEAMGDAEESADLIDYYCQQMDDATGFVQPMARITPVERNTDVLRPYGVFACIAPFNFPLALSAGMSSAALVAGNTVVYKPAEETPWTGLKLYEVYRAAGLPDGVFNVIIGRREEIGDALWQHPDVDGVVFTGSKAVGMRIHQGLSGRYIKPALLELGGKNDAIVTATGDIDAAAEGVMRSAFSLQNQKCSATSRVYVESPAYDIFMDRLVAKTRSIRMGDPSERDVFFGPVINQQSVERFETAVAQARTEGSIVLGGERLRGGVFDRGHFVAPTIARLPLESALFRQELFIPFLAVAEVSGLDQALAETNRVEYGLTAGIFSGNPAEVERFFDEVEAGVCYANKRTGATTGAWPGAQPFCGWKGSGSTGKGGCGPYYVAQFMREQSRTVIED
jgi:1-pyrroline-5-carboxylate dehydrogenase